MKYTPFNIGFAAFLAWQGYFAWAAMLLLVDLALWNVVPKLYMWFAGRIDRAIPGTEANIDFDTLRPEAGQESTPERMLRVKRELAAIKKH